MQIIIICCPQWFFNWNFIRWKTHCKQQWRNSTDATKFFNRSNFVWSFYTVINHQRLIRDWQNFNLNSNIYQETWNWNRIVVELTISVQMLSLIHTSRTYEIFVRSTKTITAAARAKNRDDVFHLIKICALDILQALGAELT